MKKTVFIFIAFVPVIFMSSCQKKTTGMHSDSVISSSKDSIIEAENQSTDSTYAVRRLYSVAYALDTIVWEKVMYVECTEEVARKYQQDMVGHIAELNFVDSIKNYQDVIEITRVAE